MPYWPLSAGGGTKLQAGQKKAFGFSQAVHPPSWKHPSGGPLRTAPFQSPPYSRYLPPKNLPQSSKGVVVEAFSWLPQRGDFWNDEFPDDE
jgi:hypothetical protein